MLNNDYTNSTLVPIDFSETSLYALEHAAAMASIINEKNKFITLLHVIEGANFNSVADSSQIETGSRDALAIEGAINRLKNIAEKYVNTTGVEFKFLVASGKAYKKIAEVAGQINADLIVMGTHGSSGIQAFAGSNASRVIYIAPCPVVVIKEKPLGRGYHNIVLPLDLTLETKQKINFAVKVAKYYNSTIHIVTMRAEDEFFAQRLNNNLAQVERYLDDRGIKFTTTRFDSEAGTFTMQILAYAQGKDADLIVIMAEQEKGWAEYIYGTTSQQLVSRSVVPVMAVTPNEQLKGVVDNTLGSGIYSH